MSRNQCQFCPKSYQSKNELDKHLKVYHNFTGKTVIIDDNLVSILGWMEDHKVEKIET